MKRWLLIVVSLIILGSLIGWRLNAKRQADTAQATQRQNRTKAAPTVTVAAASVRDLVQTFETIGNVESPFSVKLAPKSAGQIEFLQVHEGDHVTVGQVLVRIDPAEAQAQVRQQQANVAEAQSRLAQAQLTQNPADVSVNAQIRQQEATLESAQSDYDQARGNYSAQVAAANAAVTDMQGRVNSADAAIVSAKASIRSAQANLANAQAKFTRFNTLLQKGFVAAQEVDDARTAVDVAQGALDVARGQLSVADAALASAMAQKQAALQQAAITKTTGKTGIAAARAKITEAKAALSLAQSNTAQKPAYQANLAALRSTVAVAQAQLRDSEALLSQTVLKSPIDGFVTARYLDTGAMATAGQAIVAVQELRQVWATVPVPEEISRKITSGQAADVTMDAIPNLTFHGKVTQINPSADPSSRQFMIRVTLDNPNNTIKPGMFARVSLILGRVPNALMVPREAVQQGPTGPAVFVVNSEQIAERHPVTVGASDTNGTAILTGIKPGDNVVTLSAMPLKDGKAVRIDDKAASGSEHQGHKRRKP